MRSLAAVMSSLTEADIKALNLRPSARNIKDSGPSDQVEGFDPPMGSMA